jgi:protein phosphatase
MSETPLRNRSGDASAIPWLISRSETNGRGTNEDSFHACSIAPGFGRPPVSVLAIADGMGGHAHGEHVSREGIRKLCLSLFEALAIEPTLNRVVAPPLDTRQVAKALGTAVRQASAHVRRMVETNRWEKAGSTIVAAAILGDSAVVANLGDSPLFHYRARSDRLVKVTENHTVAGALLRAGLITPEMALVHEGRSQLEFFLGAEELPREVPIAEVALERGDLLLLCSDGVTGQVPADRVRARRRNWRRWPSD